LKNTHLLRYAHHLSLRRTGKYASLLVISRALHLYFFARPAKNHIFNNLLDVLTKQLQKKELPESRMGSSFDNIQLSIL
jgi:hypothetical protein